MDIETFRRSITSGSLPSGLSLPLRALWHDGRGDWDRAHQIVQDEEEGDGAWVHAYLHRKEGDLGNAAYWYRRAGKSVASGPLEEEWRQIAAALLGG